MGTELTVAALAGLIAPWLTAILTQVELRSAYKRLIAIAVTLLLVGVGLFASYRPDSWRNASGLHGYEAGIGRGRDQDQSGG